MSDLTDEQILTIRESYLRDRYVRAPVTIAISNYNRSGREFFTSDQIKAIDDEIAVTWREVLDDVNAEQVAVRINEGDSQDTADDSGDAMELIARYKLIEAAGIEKMLEDPGFRASLIPGDDAKGAEAMKSWEARIFRNRQWVMGRAGRAAIEVERK
ncbi:MAG TPA: hypothetical protein PLB01_00290 [Thermoanaerobaculia bacterium]|nr:hypothetical protein [Thermoanaerobaculia bacterium]